MFELRLLSVKCIQTFQPSSFTTLPPKNMKSETHVVPAFQRGILSLYRVLWRIYKERKVSNLVLSNVTLIPK